jgi:hypothetical protein
MATVTRSRERNLALLHPIAIRDCDSWVEKIRCERSHNGHTVPIGVRMHILQALLKDGP